ncbi:MAG TPA: MarR family transcriptional regulator [Flavobacteriaceae bacterium]|nr:MarR family transcriptional regulator [Flavobacteriaceae bacterium]
MNIEHFLKTNKKLPVRLKSIINILVLAGKIKREINDLLRPYGISEPLFNVLRILRGQEGKSVNLKNVQERMIHKTSNTTRLLDKLIEKDLAERSIPKENRRKVEIAITQKGMDLLSEIDPKFIKLEKKLVANLDKKEVKELNRLLEEMNDLK